MLFSEQLQADVVGRQALRGDARADHDRDQQCGADTFGEQPAGERRGHQHGRRGTSAALAAARPATLSRTASKAPGASR